MRRHVSLLAAVVSTAMVAAVLASVASGRSAASAPESMRFCARTGEGPAEILQRVLGPPWSRDDGTESREWYLLASGRATCLDARVLLPEIGRRAASRGSVVRLGFDAETRTPQEQGWRCVASREVVYAACSVRRRDGSALYVAAFAANPTGERVAIGVSEGTLEIGLFAPAPRVPGSSPPAPSPSVPGAYSGAPAERCTSIAGPRWRFADRPPAGWPRGSSYPSGQSGNRWLVWALGGLPCLAAQGWVEDLAPRVIRSFTGLGGLRADEQWRCFTGGGELLVGLCTRETSPRGLFDRRGLVIYPDVASAYIPFETRSHEEVWHAMLQYNAAEEENLMRPRLCLDVVVPSARWTVGTASGTRWAFGSVGGYGCPAGQAVQQLAEFATGTAPARITGGVGGEWRCTLNSGSQVRCHNPHSATRFTIIVQPYPNSTSHQDVEAAVIRALR